MGDVLVPEVILDQPGVCAPVSERISAGVPQHMGVDLQLPEASSICMTMPTPARRSAINLGATSTAAVTARCSATATETRGNDTTPAATWTPDGCAVGLVEPWRLK